MPRKYGRDVGYGKAISASQPLPLFVRLFDWAIESHEGFEIDGKASACWVWQGHCDEDGYPQIKWRGQKVKAHRLAFAIFNGGIGDGQDVDHQCLCRSCINPAHLVAMDPHENRVVKRHGQGECPI